MRGTDEKSGSLFSYIDLEESISTRQPQRKIQQVINDALANPDGEFASLYVNCGRPFITPERLIGLA